MLQIWKLWIPLCLRLNVFVSWFAVKRLSVIRDASDASDACDASNKSDEPKDRDERDNLKAAAWSDDVRKPEIKASIFFARFIIQIFLTLVRKLLAECLFRRLIIPPL